MASSKKPQPNELVEHVAGFVARHIPAGGRVAVGLSGGLDSIVLFDLLVSLATAHDLALSALHVNHGISRNAARWAEFCAALCERHGVPCQVAVLQVQAGPGESLEAAARDARYAEYARLSANCIALAHHADDQAETLLLQLLRGAGVKGLSAMPEARAFAGKTLLRPLLDFTRAELEAYACEHSLQWIEDESNADTSYDRNFLRHEVLPLLARRYPAYRTTLGRAARHFAETAQLLDQLAALDAGDAVHDPSRLPLAALRALDVPRAGNLLRYFLAQHDAPMPPAARLAEALHQLRNAAHDAQVCIEVDDHELHRHGDAIYLVKKMAPFSDDIHWQGEERLELPHGTLLMQRTTGAGLSLARLDAPVTLRVRAGGEKLRPDCKRPRRTLKNLLQEHQVLPWQRDTLPLLFCGDTLAWAAGIGSDCAFAAQAGEAAVLPQWQPCTPTPGAVR
ncbi:MAG: tRNA lysidine(34) synthetase TilS [Pseudomonadota bacterium]